MLTACPSSVAAPADDPVAGRIPSGYGLLRNRKGVTPSWLVSILVTAAKPDTPKFVPAPPTPSMVP